MIYEITATISNKGDFERLFVWARGQGVEVRQGQLGWFARTVRDTLVPVTGFEELTFAGWKHQNGISGTGEVFNPRSPITNQGE